MGVRPGQQWSRRAALALLGLSAGGYALGARAQQPAAPAGSAQPPAATPGATPTPAGNPDTDGRKDFSRDGLSRRDTQVLRPKDGDTISVRLPKQGQAMVASQVPWAVTGGKQTPDLQVEYDVRGIRVIHTGTGQARVSFNLRLVDGRKLTVNVRTAVAKYPVGYLVII
jgi:hypothetical protein